MKKRTKKNEMSNTKAIFKSVWIILKIPYYIIKGIIYLTKKTKEKTIEHSIEKERDSRNANYQSFKLIDTKSGDYKEFEKYLLSEKSKIGIILGARGTGKTAIGIKKIGRAHV